jgi:hypothetical protein
MDWSFTCLKDNTPCRIRTTYWVSAFYTNVSNYYKHFNKRHFHKYANRELKS